LPHPLKYKKRKRKKSISHTFVNRHLLAHLQKDISDNRDFETTSETYFVKAPDHQEISWHSKCNEKYIIFETGLRKHLIECETFSAYL
jgi:hypothetical protein